MATRKPKYVDPIAERVKAKYAEAMRDEIASEKSASRLGKLKIVIAAFFTKSVTLAPTDLNPTQRVAELTLAHASVIVTALKMYYKESVVTVQKDGTKKPGWQASTAYAKMMEAGIEFAYEEFALVEETLELVSNIVAEAERKLAEATK